MTKFGSVKGLAIRHLFPEFGELWSGVPAIPCGDMHQSFTDAHFYLLSDMMDSVSGRPEIQNVKRCNLRGQSEDKKASIR